MASFFRELKRRNVYKVAVSYAVVAWLLIQVATQVFPFLQIPDWTIRMVIVLLALGFPIALIIAWAFELTPEGLKRTEDGEAPATPRARRHGWIYIVVVGAALSVGLFFAGRYTAPPKTDVASRALEKSIAVLPFESLSEDKANAYFADGIQDEILTRLAKIAELKVISRTSTKQYESKPGNLSQIAQQLGVAHILEGSVQKSGDSVRVIVQLIKAESDSHLWGETFDRKLTDIFAVETEVAQRIADALEAKLTGREKKAISVVGTTNPAAYDAYLRGIAIRNSQQPEDQMRLLQYCREAVALDPNFAEAWAEIAFAEGLKYISENQTEAQQALVREAAENALRLDPDRGNGHAAMGLYRYYCLQEYEEALAELQQARVQAPNDAFIILAIGLVKRRQGKLEESIALQMEAASLDPLNQDVWSNLGFTYRGMRRLPEARAMYERALAIAPNDRVLQMRLANTYLFEGDLDAAERVLGKMQISFGEDGYDELIGILFLRRQYEEALAKLAADMAKAESAPPEALVFGRLLLGIFHLAAGRKGEAEALFLQVEKEMAARRAPAASGPGGVRDRLEIAAFLGRREEVQRLATELLATRGKDRWSGPRAEQAVTQAYMLVGDRERALQSLEGLLKISYADCWTPAFLRLDPLWDPVRDDPRFQKLVATKQP